MRRHAHERHKLRHKLRIVVCVLVSVPIAQGIQMAKSSKSPSKSAAGRGSSENGFETPAADDQYSDQQENGNNGGDEAFEPPSADELGSAASESETAEVEAELDDDIVALKGEIEKKLTTSQSGKGLGVRPGAWWQQYRWRWLWVRGPGFKWRGGDSPSRPNESCGLHH